MATTVIDELIVTLGLDPANFKKGQKEAAEDVAKFRLGVGQAANDVERSAGRMDTAFAAVQGRMLRLAGLFLGGLGVTEFVSRIIPATAQLGRLGTVLGMSAQELYAWQKAGGKVGATAEEITQSIASVNDDIQKFLLTGESNLMRFFNSMKAADPSMRFTKDATANMLEMARFAEGRDPQQMAALFGQMGMSPGTIQLLLQGKAAVQAYLDEFRRLAPTAEEIKKAAEAQALWNAQLAETESAARKVATAMLPVVNYILKRMGDENLFKDIEDAGTRAQRVLNNLVNAYDTLDAKTGGWLSWGMTKMFGGDSFDQRFGSWGSSSPSSPPTAGATPSWGVPGRPSGSSPPTTSSPPTAPSSPSSRGPDAGAPPEAVLEKAREVAKSGGAGAVQLFMASQGYPMSGAWCGQFAAAVVRSTGGTPPRGAAIASNWRNYGAPVQGEPKPGDVAVRKGAPTGSTGSHVTFVESYDPATGRFKGFGGNQGQWSSNFDASQFEFRRALPPASGAGLAAGNVQTDNSRTSSVRSETHIGKIEVNTQATDAQGVARALQPEIERNNTFAQQGNYGPN